MIGSPADRRASPARSVGVAVLVTLTGLVASVLVALPVFVVELDVLVRFTLSVVLSELGFVVASLIFLLATGRGLGFLDLRRPDRRAVWYAAGGTALLFGFRLVAIAAVQVLGLPAAGNAISELAEQGLLETLLVLIPVSVLVVGPAEELLFRGVVQKYLYGGFSRWNAILVTSVLFSLVHVPTTYAANTDPVAVLVTLAILFGLSVILGLLYVRTENLLVPMAAHGVYDAILFALAYVVLSVQRVPATGLVV